MLDLFTVLFADSAQRYKDMADVLVESARVKSPNTPVIKVIVDSDDSEVKAVGKGRPEGYVQNTRKTKHHCDIVHKCASGSLVGLLDCDTMVLRDCSPIFDSWVKNPFDIALTFKEGECRRFIMNSGVVFVHVNERTQELYQRWLGRAYELLHDRAKHAKWQMRYGGINQSAVGSLLEDGCTCKDLGLRICHLSTREWNALGEDHYRAMDVSHIVHVIGRLRRAVTQPRVRSVSSELRPLVSEWRQYFDNVRKPARRG